MASEVGAAYVTILPSTRGFGSKLSQSLSGDVVKTGTAQGKRFGGAMGVGLRSAAGLGTGAAALGLGALVKSSVSAEAEFSQTMNTMAAVAQVPQKQIKALSTLALKMGADTVFSAQDAADAMLELAKGGLTTAQIRAGALKETLTLAAASGVDMATAATVMSNSMNTFGLSAKDAPKVTAALAGGANSSTASIGSLGEALQQVGPGAVTAGLSIQETVGALAAFDNAGIKGSDAGTSLKTMLTRLVPQTTKAKAVMKAYGLTFTDAQGNFLPFIKIAGNLKKAFRGLSEEQKTSDLSKLFGSDASRAAGVLSNLGKKGIQPFIKATKDQGAAQRIAAARMAGTSGAIENLKGSFDTAKIKIGQALAPAIVAGANLATKALNGLSNHLPGITAKFKTFGHFVKNNFDFLGPFAGTILAVVAAIKIWRGAQLLLNLALSANPVGLVVIAIAAFIGLLVLAYQRSETFRKIVNASFHFVQVAAGNMVAFIIRGFKFLLGIWFAVVGGILHGAAKAFGWVPGLGGKLKGASKAFDAFKDSTNATLDSLARGAAGWGDKAAKNYTQGLTAGLVKRGVAVPVAVGTSNKVGALARSGKAFEGTGGGGTIVVNNPKPEPASESVDKALRRKRHAAGWAGG